MSEVYPFPVQPAPTARRRRNSRSADVLDFPRRLPIAYADRIVMEGRKYRSWVCMIHRPGDEPGALPVKDEKTARFVAGLMLKNFAEDRAVDRDPVAQHVRALFELSPDMRKAVGRKLLGLDE
jgi:hypothetical protein